MPAELVEAMERIEDAAFGRLADEARAEMDRTGEAAVPLDEVYQELGL